MEHISTHIPHTIDALLGRRAVQLATSKSRATIYREIRAGLFPRPVKISAARVAWISSEVASINAARIAGKSDNEIRKLVIELEAARTTTIAEGN